MYRWNKADVYTKDQGGESYGAFGMLLRDIGVSIEDFSKHTVPKLVFDNMDALVKVYGLRDAVDLEMITVANDCSNSQDEMVLKVIESLSGNLTSVSPGMRHWLQSLVETRSQHPMPTKTNELEGKYYSKEKLNDVRWHEKRDEVLRRDGNRCQGIDEDGKQCRKCKKNGDSLEIHHRNYTISRDTRNPWDEPLENLITLCRKHHEAERNENLGKAARDVCSALMKSNWMVGQRELLATCISKKIVSPEDLCRFISERMK